MSKKAFFALLFAGFASLLGLGIISPILPFIAVKYGADGFWIGVIFAGFLVSSAISMYVVGRISDVAGRKVFLGIGLSLYAVSSLFYLIAFDKYSLTLVRMIHGFASGMIVPVILAYAGEFAQERREAKTMAIFSMVFFVGLGCGPLLGGFLDNIWGYKSLFYAMAAIGALAFFVVLFFVPETEAHKIIQKEDLMPFKTLVTYNSVRAVLIVTILAAFRSAALMSFLPLLAFAKSVSVSQVGILLSSIMFFAGLLQMPFAHLADVIGQAGRMSQIVIGSALSTVAFFAVPFCPDFYSMLIACSVVGIGAAISTPAAMGVSVLIGQKVGMGSWMGMFNTTKNGGMIVSPLIAGVIMDRLGVEYVFYAFTIVCIFGLVLSCYYIYRRLQGYRQG